MKLQYQRVETPVGEMELVQRGETVLLFEFAQGAGRQRAKRRLASRFGECELIEDALDSEHLVRIKAYFGGELGALDPIPVDPGGTPFQAAVWAQLRRIPVGHTCSYADVASAVGRATATRAVGAANGQNPIAVILPCHRVIGADGSLTGFGGGLDRKRWLLRHEGVTVAEPAPSLPF